MTVDYFDPIPNQFLEEKLVLFQAKTRQLLIGLEQWQPLLSFNLKPQNQEKTICCAKKEISSDDIISHPVFEPVIDYFVIKNSIIPPVYSLLTETKFSQLEQIIEQHILSPYQDVKNQWRKDRPNSIPEGFDRLMEKVDQPFHTRRNYLKNKLQEIDLIIEYQHIFAEFLTKILGDTLIKLIVPTLARGLQAHIHKDPSVALYYINCIEIFNLFLSKLGVKTAVLQPNDKINYDLYTPVPIMDGSNETPDLSKKDCVKEVLQYAYYFSDEYIIAEGQAICWKVK